MTARSHARSAAECLTEFVGSPGRGQIPTCPPLGPAAGPLHRDILGLIELVPEADVYARERPLRNARNGSLSNAAAGPATAPEAACARNMWTTLASHP